MKVLLTGSAGYIGPVVRELLEMKGFEVIGYDKLLYGGSAEIVADIRDVDKMIVAIDSVDAVVHLAGLSMDLLADMEPHHTWDINYLANKNIADLMKNTGKRIIYASSGSVYGVQEGTSKEDSSLRPLTPYAKSKALSEELFLQPNIDSICFRFATAYGMAPNPRLDTVANHMIATSYFENKIVVNGSSRCRAILHVKDIARGILMALEGKPRHRVYNLGSDNQNFRIGDLGALIHDQIPSSELIIDDSDDKDKRSYVIGYGRVKKDFGFQPVYTVEDAVFELYDAFKSGKIKELNQQSCYRVRSLKENGSL